VSEEAEKWVFQRFDAISAPPRKFSRPVTTDPRCRPHRGRNEPSQRSVGASVSEI
jgi:hypothetical protein